MDGPPFVRFFSLFWCLCYNKSKRHVYADACLFGKQNISLKKDFTNTIKKLLKAEPQAHWVKKMIAIVDRRLQVHSTFVYHDDEYVNQILHEFLTYRKVTVKEDASMSTEFKAWLRIASEEDKHQFADLGQTNSRDEMQFELKQKKTEDNVHIVPEKPDKNTDKETDKGTVADSDKEMDEKMDEDSNHAESKDSSDGGDNISNNDNNKGVPLDNNEDTLIPKGSVKTEKKGKDKCHKVSTPETASIKGSDETATATPAKGSSKKLTKDKKPDVVTETITLSHGIVSNVIPGLIDTTNQTPSPFVVKSFWQK